MFALDKMQQQIVDSIRQFVEREVIPVASELEHQDEYPHAIVERMKEFGLFGANVPEEYGGLGLDTTTYAMIMEELARGWMSIVGPLGTHSVICDIINRFGTEEQKQEFLPGLAAGERRGGERLRRPQPQRGDAADRTQNGDGDEGDAVGTGGVEE